MKYYLILFFDISSLKSSFKNTMNKYTILSNMQTEKSHSLLPVLRRRPIVEETCRAERSHNERGVSASVSESASTEEADVDAEVELRCFSNASLLCPCGEACGEAEPEWVQAGGPVCSSLAPFPSPSRWAWNVQVCCSRERKHS